MHEEIPHPKIRENQNPVYESRARIYWEKKTQKQRIKDGIVYRYIKKQDLKQKLYQLVADWDK